MKREQVKALMQVLTPLILLGIFTLFICFPEGISFFAIRPRSSKGIGTETFTVAAATTAEAKKGSVSFAMKRVPPGVAPTGCTDVPGGTIVTEPFLLAETEVTGELWKAVIEHAETARFVFSGNQKYGHLPNTPVAKITWRDAIVFCNALSAIQGLTPVYRFTDGAVVDGPVTSVLDIERIGEESVVAVSGANGFRLPASDEWELAARYRDGVAWTPGSHPSGSPFPYYEDTRSSLYAVFESDSVFPVRSRASNELGIYDMSGNVWEWCFDAFSDEKGVEKRVVRGGGWIGTPYRLQIGGEFGSKPEILEQAQGFRIAKSGW